MNRKKLEEQLIQEIREYKKSVRLSLREKLYQEREEQHRKGEVFFDGDWIPQDKIANIQKKLQRRGLAIFLEIHLLVFIVILLNILLWFGFKIFLLP